MRISIPPMFGEKWNDYVPTTHVGGAATAATKENLWGFDLAKGIMLWNSPKWMRNGLHFRDSCFLKSPKRAAFPSPTNSRSSTEQSSNQYKYLYILTVPGTVPSMLQSLPDTVCIPGSTTYKYFTDSGPEGHFIARQIQNAMMHAHHTSPIREVYLVLVPHNLLPWYSYQLMSSTYDLMPTSKTHMCTS
jgi:hypothetical protein